MKIHILGICGTFMGGMALLARAQGHEVSGQDAGVYPPMSTQLAEQGITLHEGYGPEAIPEDVDMVIFRASRGYKLLRFNSAARDIMATVNLFIFFRVSDIVKCFNITSPHALEGTPLLNQRIIPVLLHLSHSCF